MDKKEVSEKSKKLLREYKSDLQFIRGAIRKKDYDNAARRIDHLNQPNEFASMINKAIDDRLFSCVPTLINYTRQFLNTADATAAKYGKKYSNREKLLSGLDTSLRMYKNAEIPEDGNSDAKKGSLMEKLLSDAETAMRAVEDIADDLLRVVEEKERGNVLEESAEEKAVFEELFMEGPEDIDIFIESAGDQVFEEAGLSDSYIFKKLNDTSSITTRLSQIIKTGSIVTKDFIEEQYNQINKTHLSPLSDKVIQAYDTGMIKLVYNANLHLTIALPFMITKIGGKYCAIICIGDFCSVTRDGTSLNIEMKKLYTLMEAAYVGLHYYTRTNVFNRSSVIAKLTATVYSEMMLRILNKEFALSLNKEAYDQVNYSIARFYLTQILELSSEEVIHSYARGCCKSPDNTTMELIKTSYEGANIQTVEDLLKFFVGIYPKMERLTFRYFFERWVSSYAIGATLAIDNFPYLYYAILSVLLGSFMVNNTALNDLVKNITGMQHFHGEVSRLV